MTITKFETEINSQPTVTNVEHAFVANLHGNDVLFLKAEGIGPRAYRLPDGFIERLHIAKRKEPLFELGSTEMTPGALEALHDSGQTPGEFLNRHQEGDWGNVCEEDWNENDLSVKEGFRILSSYQTNNGVKLWCVTESDRSATTLLLPENY